MARFRKVLAQVSKAAPPPRKPMRQTLFSQETETCQLRGKCSYCTHRLSDRSLTPSCGRAPLTIPAALLRSLSHWVLSHVRCAHGKCLQAPETLELVMQQAFTYLHSLGSFSFPDPPPHPLHPLPLCYGVSTPRQMPLLAGSHRLPGCHADLRNTAASGHPAPQAPAPCSPRLDSTRQAADTGRRPHPLPAGALSEEARKAKAPLKPL